MSPPLPWKPAIARPLVLAAALVFAVGPASGQMPFPKSASPQGAKAAVGEDSAREGVLAERAALAAEIESLEERIKAAPDAAGDLMAERLLLERTDHVYEERLAALERSEQLERLETGADPKLVSGPKNQIARQPPFSLALVDALAGAIRAHRVRHAAVAAACEAAGEARDQGRAALASAPSTTFTSSCPTAPSWRRTSSTGPCPTTWCGPRSTSASRTGRLPARSIA
jgi:hypothetical protein